jgi:uncharacterized protein
MYLALAGALLIGLSLGLLGSGGSILTVPVLVYLVGQDEKVAIAGSLAIVGAVSLVGSLPHALRGQVSWRNVLLFGVPGMGGTYVGALLSQFVSGTTQLVLFSVVMASAAVMMLRREKRRPSGSRKPRSAWKIGVDGVLVGVLTGLVGVGGGFLIVPALVLLGGMPMRLAVGTSLFIIAMKSASGFYKYLGVLGEQDLKLDWTVLGTFCALGILGTFAGSALADKLPQSTLRRVFGGLLLLMAIFILWRTLASQT